MSMLRTSELEPVTVETSPTLEPPSTASPVAGERPVTGSITAAWAWVLAGAWLLITGIGFATAPAPADPAAEPPVIAVLLNTTLQVIWLVMIVGLVRLRRAGALASLAGAGLLLVDAIACPVTGHHDWAAGWSLFQLAGAVVLVGLSTRAVLSAKS
jgi:hypothetical protein